MTVDERIDSLRTCMRRVGAVACIVPQADPHLGEYVEEHWQLRSWFTGFTGSNGTLVVTQQEALVWTDSRYYLQVERQLAGTCIQWCKQEEEGWEAWMLRVLPAQACVMADARVFACQQWMRLRQHFVLVDDSSFENLWQDRPALRKSQAFCLPLEVCGVTPGDKLNRLRAALRLTGEQVAVFASLDSIAWLLNIRGGDLPCTPVLRSYLKVGATSAWLYVAPGSLTDEVVALLQIAGVEVVDYATFYTSLSGQMVLADDAEMPAGVLSVVTPRWIKNPIPAWKAIKHPAELAVIEKAMVQDGVMWVRFLRALEAHLTSGEMVRESTIVQLLQAGKAEREGYWGESFETIAAYGEHGAIVHYAVTPDTDGVIQPRGLLLIDTGTQYMGATTDMTRTLACGPLTAQEKSDCTYVMKAHIALASAVFPEGMSGAALDGVARRPLWKVGLNYGHGTGHGVGAMLSVHEGPVRVAWATDSRMRAGMVTSDEPGVYRAGKHGVRLENMVAVVPAEKTEFGEFLKFKILTLCPFDVRVLETSLLTAQERRWLNDYHRCVKQALAPWLTQDERDWLNSYAYEI